MAFSISLIQVGLGEGEAGPGSCESSGRYLFSCAEAAIAISNRLATRQRIRCLLICFFPGRRAEPQAGQGAAASSNYYSLGLSERIANGPRSESPALISVVQFERKL